MLELNTKVNTDVTVVESFVYIGAEIHNTGSSEPEVRRRIGLAKSALTSWIEGSGVPLSHSPQKFNYTVPISSHSYCMALKHGPWQEPYKTR